MSVVHHDCVDKALTTTVVVLACVGIAFAVLANSVHNDGASWGYTTLMVVAFVTAICLVCERSKP